MVIEDAAEADVGSIGSNNILSWKLKGCVGVVTSATARDTDEIILERAPLYLHKPGCVLPAGSSELPILRVETRSPSCRSALIVRLL